MPTMEERRAALAREMDMFSVGSGSSGIVSIPSRSAAPAKGKPRSVSVTSSVASEDSFVPGPGKRLPPRDQRPIEISDDDEDDDNDDASFEVRKPTKAPTKKPALDLSDDDDDDDGDASFEVRQPVKTKPKARQATVELSDDDEDGSSFQLPQAGKTRLDKSIVELSDSDDESSGPQFPVPRPAVQLPAPSFPIPKPYQPPTTGSSKLNSRIGTSQPQPTSRVDAPARPLGPSSKPAVPIRAPAVGAIPSRPPASQRDDENYDIAVEDRFDVKRSAEDAQKELHDLLAGTQEIDVEVDEERAVVEGLADGIVLKAHQVISRDWMEAREEGKKPGGILADDMGLGKTLQSIVRIVDGRRGDRKQAPTLVVTPASVVPQWVDEIQKFAPGLVVHMYMGAARTTDARKLEKVHVVVTSYTTVSYEHKAYAGDGKSEGTKRSKSAKDTLFRVEFHRVILDEAHTIKNRSTQTAKGCFALKSTKRWCLTGTPMQNGVEELFSLFHFIGVRPYHDWQKYNDTVVKPFKAGRTGAPLKRIQVVLKGVMLRRLKTDMVNGKPLIELPGREVETLFCEFDDDERAFYDALANKIEIAVSKFQRAGSLQANYTAILTLLLRLRQACNHPGLVTRDLLKDKDALESKPADKGQADPLRDDEGDELADALAGLTVETSRKCTVCFARLTASNSSTGDTACTDCAKQLAKQSRRRADDDDALPPTSAKIRKVLELLHMIRERGEGEKTIIFSQFTSWLDILDPFLRDEGIHFVRLDGSMKIEERQESLQKIKTSKRTNVILVSFKAGSTGLNLTSCNFVILVDLWWNPALEEQAFDRAHRLGQTRDVKIYKLTIENTVEQRILELQEKKRAEARAVLAGDKIKGNKLNINELMALFRPGGGGHEDEDED